MLIQRCLNLASTLVKAILNPIGLVMIVDCEIVEYMLNTWIVFILLNEKIFFYYILAIQLLMKYKKFSNIGTYRNTQCWSSCPEVFNKKGFLRNFLKFTGKHLCQSLFFTKVAGQKPATLTKRRLCHRCFPMDFVKFLRTPFYIEHLWWLLNNGGIHRSLNCCIQTSKPLWKI